MRPPILLALASLTMAGCSAELAVQGLDPQATANTSVDGLPFRVKERYVVELYRKTNEGYKRVNDDQPQTMANPDQLFVLQHVGQPLSDSDSKFALNPDGTLSSVHLGSKTNAAQTLTAARQELESFQKAEETGRAAAEAAQGKGEQGGLDYVTAVGAVRVAEAKLSALPPTATSADRVALENELLQAKVKANIAARKAGVARPYPDVGV